MQNIEDTFFFSGSVKAYYIEVPQWGTAAISSKWIIKIEVEISDKSLLETKKG